MTENLFDPSPGNAFLRRLPATGGGGKITPGIPRVLEHIATKFQRYVYVFGVKLSSSGTCDFVGIAGRRCVQEIQDGSQINESTNNFAGFTDIHVVPKTIHGFMTMYETSKCPAILADAISCRKSKMAANYPEVVISPKILTATPMFSGSSFLEVVLPNSWDVDMC